MSALYALLLAAPAFAQDAIIQLDGSITEGAIQLATVDAIEWTDSRGKSHQLKSSKILDLDLGSIKSLLKTGNQFLAVFDYQNAVGAFSGSARGDGLGATIASLRIAETLLTWSSIDAGKAKEAEAAFTAWLAANPDSWFSPRAQTGKAMAAALSGDTVRAAKMFEDLAAFAFEKDFPIHVELSARLGRCQVFLMGKQANVAEARLRDLVPKIADGMTASNTSGVLRIRLRLLHSQGQILLGDAIEAKDGVAKARSYWNKLSNDRNSSLDVRAAATVGAARAARQAGSTREAQLLLAQVVATMPASREVTARAIFALAETCEELGNTPTSAKSYYRRLVDDYSSTTWAIKARSKLGSEG